MCLGEQVDDCIGKIIDERSEAARCGVFGHIDLNIVLIELVLVMEEVGDRE